MITLYENDNNIEYSNETDSEGTPLTVAQSKFFHNSKIRNGHNNLLVMYHASDSEFSVFDKGKIGSGSGGLFGKGFYFGDESLASGYGSKIRKFYLNIENPYRYYTSDKKTIMSLLTKSPYKYDKDFVDNFDFDILKWDGDIIDDFLSDALVDKDAYDVFSDMVKNAGYDGIIAGDEIIAFAPNQMKLTSNLNPTNHNDINEDLVNSSDIELDTYSTDYFGGALRYRTDAILNGEVVGYIQYAIAENTIYVDIIEVSEEYRRQGIGTAIVNELKRLYPDYYVSLGMTTKDGTPFFKDLVKHIKNPTYTKLQNKLNKLKDLEAQANEYYEDAEKQLDNAIANNDEKLADEIRDKYFFNVSSKYNLNDIHDKMREVEDKLSYTPKYFTKFK